MRHEIRSMPAPIELRADEESGLTRLVGIAPPWNTLSVNFGGWRERFARGAFKNLEQLDVISTFEHDGRLLLGRTPKTLTLEDAADGLRYEVDLPATSFAKDLAESVARGDVRGSSFEFMVIKEHFETGGDDTPVRVVTEAELFQVGPVTNPAYQDGTDVALRSLESWRKEREMIEAEERQGFEVQTLIFPKRHWDSASAAMGWAEDHDFRADKVDETEESYRLRQRDPSDFERLRTICISPGRDTPPDSDECEVKAVGGPVRSIDISEFEQRQKIAELTL